MLWWEHDLTSLMSQISWLMLGNKELLSMTLQQILRQTQAPSRLWMLVHDLQRRPVNLEWEVLSLFPHPFLKTTVSWKTAAKTSSCRTSSMSRRAWTFTFALSIGSPLLAQIKAQEKIKWGTSAKRLNYQSRGFSSVCVRRHIIWKCFSFSFGSFPVHREPERFLVQIVVSPCHLAGYMHMGGKWCYLSESKRIICWISFMEEKRGKKRVQESNSVQLAGMGAGWDHFLGQRWAAPSSTQWLSAYKLCARGRGEGKRGVRSWTENLNDNFFRVLGRFGLVFPFITCPFHEHLCFLLFGG